jgi:hypothetical protein
MSTRNGKICLRVMLGALAILPAQAGTVLSGSASTGGPDTFGVSGLDFGMAGASPFHYSSVGACSLSACTEPGTYSFFDGIASETFGLSGSYTVNGVTYSFSCNSGTTCGGGISFQGTLTLPDQGPTPPSFLTVTAPFTSEGGIAGVMISPGVFAPSLNFVGGGIATINLRRINVNAYSYLSSTYDFVPTPEPATMGFVGLGLVVLTLGRRALSRWMVVARTP